MLSGSSTFPSVGLTQGTQTAVIGRRHCYSRLIFYAAALHLVGLTLYANRSTLGAATVVRQVSPSRGVRASLTKNRAAVVRYSKMVERRTAFHTTTAYPPQARRLLHRIPLLDADDPSQRRVQRISIYCSTLSQPCSGDERCVHRPLLESVDFRGP